MIDSTTGTYDPFANGTDAITIAAFFAWKHGREMPNIPAAAAVVRRAIAGGAQPGDGLAEFEIAVRSGSAN